MSGVYFVKHKGFSPIKIGYTSKLDAKHRIHAMNTASPYGIIELGFISTTNAQELEKEIHERFKSKRLNGEWFDISTEEVLEIIKDYDYENQSELLKISNMLKELNIPPHQVENYLRTKIVEKNQFPLDMNTTKFMRKARLVYESSVRHWHHREHKEYVHKSHFMSELERTLSKSRATTYRYMKKYDYLFDERMDGKSVYVKPIWGEEE